MKKPLIFGIAGLLAAGAVGFAVFTFVLGGKGEPLEAAQGPSGPVNVPGKVGPRVTTADRVFNLKSPASDPKYLKMQATIEFETSDPMWGWVLGGCKGEQPKPAKKHASTLTDAAPAMVSADPLAARDVVRPLPNSGGTEVEGLCAATEKTLMAAFDGELGTGLNVIEDIVTTVVTRHSFDEVSSPDGKEQLKREIQDAIEQAIHEPKVVRVLFTNFVSQ